MIKFLQQKNSKIKLINKKQKRVLESKMFQQNKQKNPKSSILWNVVDPDDPYDIRKSMIARLPDHTQNFMGGNIEIVCLMQAAEIQRLSDNLAQNQLKYREVQRKQLDRHSYEIQIKQLSQRANQSSKYRQQIQKLRDYIKKLTLQLEQQTQNTSSASVLQQKYDQLYKKYQSLLLQLQNSRQNIETLNININKIMQQNKELRIKYDKLDKLRLTQITQQRQKYEIKIRERIEVEIKEVQHRYNVRIGQLESDCRLYRDQLQTKNHEIASLISRNQSLRRDLETKQKQKPISTQYEQKMSQLQRINNTLSQKASQMQQIYNHYSNLQLRLKQTQRIWKQCEQQNKYYKSQLQRINRLRNQDEERDGRIMIELENKTALLSQQVQRLLLIIQNKNKDINGFQMRINATKSEYQSRIRQIVSEYQYKLQAKNQSKQKIQSLQSELKPLRQLTIQLKLKNQLLTKQLTSNTLALKRGQQLQNQLKNADLIISQKNDQICRLEAWLKNNQSLTMEISTLRNNINEYNKFIRSVQAVYGITVLGTRDGIIDSKQLENLNRAVGRTHEQKEELRKQLQREVLATHQITNKYNSRQRQLLQLNDSLNKARTQIRELKRINQQYQSDIRKGTLITLQNYEIQIKKITNQTKISVQRQFSSQLQRNLQERQKIIGDVQNEKKILQQEISSLKDKLQRKNNQQQLLKNHIETRYSNQIHDLTTSLKALRQQNEKTINEKNKLKTALNQVEKQLISKQRQYVEASKDLAKKFEQQRNTSQQLQRDLSKFKQDLINLQQSNSRGQRQAEERIMRMFTVQIQDKDSSIASLERQLKNSKDELKSIQQFDQKTRNDVKNYRDRLLKASEQLDRLNQILLNKNSEINTFNQRISSLQQNYIRQLSQKDQQFKKIINQRGAQDSLRRDLHDRQQQNRNLKSHLANIENLHKRHLQQKQTQVQTLQSQVNSLHNQIKSLQGKLQPAQAQLLTLQSSVSSFQAQKRQLQERIKEISNLKNTLNRENEDSQKLRKQHMAEIQNIQAKYQRILREKDEQIQKQRAQKGLRLAHQRDLIEKALRVEYESKIKLYVDRQSKISNQYSNLHRINEQISRQLSETRKQYSTFVQKSKMLQSSNDQRQLMEKRISQQQYEIRNLKQMLQQLQQVSAHTLVERDNLLRSAYQLQSQIQKYKTIIRENEKNQTGSIRLKEQINQLRIMCAKYQEQIRIMNINIQQNTRKYRDNQGKIAMIVVELQRLNSIVSERDRQIVQLSEENFKSKQYIDKLIRQKEQRTPELQSLLLQLQRIREAERGYLVQIQNLKQMLEEMQEINLHTTAERDQLFQFCHKYQEENQNLKKMLDQNQKYHGANQQAYDELASNFSFLKIQNSQLREKLGRFQGQSQILSRQNKQYERKISQLVTEMQRLGFLIRQRQKESHYLSEMQERISVLQQQLLQQQQQQKRVKTFLSQQWQKKYNHLYKVHKQYVQESTKNAQMIQRSYEEIKMKVKQHLQDNQQLLLQNQQLASRIKIVEELIQKNKILGSQIDRLNGIIGELRKQLQDTRQRLGNQMALQRRIQQDLGLMVIMFAQIQTMRNRLSQSQLQCENIRRNSLTPHRVDRQTGRSLDSRPR